MTEAIIDELEKEIKEKKGNFYNRPSRPKMNFYFENLDKEKRKEYMQETNLKTYNINDELLKSELKDITLAKIKLESPEKQKQILLELQKMYHSDSKIADHVKAHVSSVYRLRTKLNIPSLNPQFYNRNNRKTIGTTNNTSKQTNLHSNLHFEFKIENQTPCNILNQLTYLLNTLDKDKKYNLKFKIKERCN